MLILKSRVADLLSYWQAAAAGKVSGVHDLRVAAKRLREALRVLKPLLPKAARREVLPVVERVNDALGQVRDRDVLRQSFKTLMKDDPRLEDLQPLRRQLARERRSYQAQLVETLSAIERESFSQRYRLLMKALREAAREDGQPIGGFAAAAVLSRLADVEANLEAISGRHDSAAFHRERIRVKKLRYALEPFLTILPAAVKQPYRLISQLQELMGEVHDQEVQREFVKRWAAEHGMTEGLKVALEELTARRRRLLNETRAHLKRMLEAQFAERLRELMGTLTEAA